MKILELRVIDSALGSTFRRDYKVNGEVVSEPPEVIKCEQDKDQVRLNELRDKMLYIDRPMIEKSPDIVLINRQYLRRGLYVLGIKIRDFVEYPEPTITSANGRR